MFFSDLMRAVGGQDVRYQPCLCECDFEAELLDNQSSTNRTVPVQAVPFSVEEVQE